MCFYMNIRPIINAKRIISCFYQHNFISSQIKRYQKENDKYVITDEKIIVKNFVLPFHQCTPHATYFILTKIVR